MLKIIKSPSSAIIIAIILFVLGVNNNQAPAENKTIINHDIVSYYSYLPAFFIEKDISLSFINESNKTRYFTENKYWPGTTSDGKKVIKMTMGMSVLYAPFFGIAHLSAEYLGYEANGFTYPYQLLVLCSGLFYLTIGLIFLKKSLLIFFSDKITAITLFIIYFASNLLCYSTLQSAYSHQYTFFLFSVLIFSTIKWHAKPNWKFTLLIGITMGLLSLIRAINIMFILVFVLFNVNSFSHFKERIKLLFDNYLHVLVMLVLIFLVFLPQLLYWKYVTGHYFFNSYIGERFYFLNPHIVQCLVGFRKGWLIYSPVFIFSLIGIYFISKRKEGMFLPVFVLMPIYFYVVSSWWCWWYGGSFGLRSMIDTYPLLAFPLASFIKIVLEKSRTIKIVVCTIMALFVILNCFQTIQFHYNIINYDSMTFRAYKDRFFKTTRADCDKSLLEKPDYTKCRLGNDTIMAFDGE